MDMKFLKFFIILIFTLPAHSKECTYEFDQERAVITGTGYKTSEKIGVDGNFPGVKLNKTERKKRPSDLLKNLVVTVDLVSLDSGNSLRDKNLRETLFANILGDSVVEVTVDKIEKDKLKTTMKINEQTQKIDFTYKVDKEKITAEGVFDAVKFSLGDQIAALKKRCGSLHTGEDGKSVTWTDFKISVLAPLKKECK